MGIIGQPVCDGLMCSLYRPKAECSRNFLDLRNLEGRTVMTKANFPNFVLPEAVELKFQKLDDQHAALVELVNRMSSDCLVRSVEEFERALADHFAYEERLMKDTAFPRLSEHEEQHGKIFATVRQTARAMLDGDQNLCEGTRELFTSIIDDALRADLAYKIYLEDLGLVRD